jgi:hypothetical protein
MARAVSRTQAPGQALAAEIEGVTATVMEGLDHFAMSENPALFKKYFRPDLEQAAAR